MKTVSFAEARGSFKDRVAAAARGEVLQITRHGKAVAELRPTAEAEQASWRDVKPLNIGKGGLSRLLLDELRVKLYIEGVTSKFRAGSF